MKQRLSPQEKKALSYRKDRRNTYGERGSHSRHALAAHKKRDRRAFRHEVGQILGTADITASTEAKDLTTQVKAVVRRSWKKWPDTALQEVVAGKLARRQKLVVSQG